MTIELTPEMEAIVTGRLNSGRYSSATAVIEEALQAVQSENNRFKYESEREKQERTQRIRQLFAEIDAAGGLQFEVERDTRPAEERECW